MKRLLTFATLALLLGCNSEDSNSEDTPSEPSGSDTRTALDAPGPDAETPPLDAGSSGDSGPEDASLPPDEGPIAQCEPPLAAQDDGDCVFDWSSDYAALTAGVKSLHSGGAILSTLVTHGTTAFPVVRDVQGAAIVAAARVGEGRSLVFGHETHLTGALLSAGGDTEVLLKNAIAWMSESSDPVVGVAANLEPMSSWLSGAGYSVKTVSPEELEGVDIYVAKTYDTLTEAQRNAIEAHLTSGGGLILAGHCWYWAQTHSNPATEYPGNLLLMSSGITISPRVGTETTSVTLGSPPGLADHALYAVYLARRHVLGDLVLELEDQQVVGATVGRALEVLPIQFDYFATVQDALATLPAIYPTEAAPILPLEVPIDALLVRVDNKLAQELPTEELEPHPAAADFPYAVPEDAPDTNSTVLIDGTYAGRDPRYAFSAPQAPRLWSTGVYARPGVPVTVSVPASVADEGLMVQVGAHSDLTWEKEEWSRFPQLVRRTPIETAETVAGNVFGGPVYIAVPAGSTLGSFEVTVSGGVSIPYFVTGSTSVDEWIGEIRDRPAPWAELQIQDMILTVPSEVIRTLDDPDVVLAFWQEVMDLDAELAGIDQRVRPERVVCDRQISLGWMHSGYPFMAHLASAVSFTTSDGIALAGDWGAFHELGHNHQFYDWVLPGTTEASVNLWSVYNFEELLGIDRGEAHEAVAPEARKQRMEEYLATGPDFSKWSVWTALETYLQLQEAFGWEMFKLLFSQYRNSPISQSPTSDAERIDRWVVKSSQVVGMNLGPFYLAWGFPISANALSSIASLPEWTDHPLADLEP